MSECYRITLTYADDSASVPGSVVLKVAATDPNSRQTGRALGLYEREVRFYTDIAPGLSGPVAPCYHAAYDPESGAFDLLLGDAAPAVVGDEVRGATVEQAALALAELGEVHGALLGDTALADASWLHRESPLNQALVAQLWAGFSERYRDDIAPSTGWCASDWWPRSTPTSPPKRQKTGCTAWSTVTTGSTTCCSASPAPTGR